MVLAYCDQQPPVPCWSIFTAESVRLTIACLNDAVRLKLAVKIIQIAGECGETGRRAGFRFQWGNPWEFESPHSHQPSSLQTHCFQVTRRLESTSLLKRHYFSMIRRHSDWRSFLSNPSPEVIATCKWLLNLHPN